MVFRSAKVAVFVDGCFWHGCAQHFVPPKTNPEYWQTKIDTNRMRDADTDRLLTDVGWVVMHFWEHEDPAPAARRVLEVVRARQQSRAKLTLQGTTAIR